MRKSYKSLKELVASIVNMGWMPVDAILVRETPTAPRPLRRGRGERAHHRAARDPARDHERAAQPAAEGAGRQGRRSGARFQGDGRARDSDGGGHRGHRGAGGAARQAPHGRRARAHAAAAAGRAAHQPRAAVEVARPRTSTSTRSTASSSTRPTEPEGEAAPGGGGAAAPDGRHGERLNSWKVRKGHPEPPCPYSRFRAAFEDRLPEGEALRRRGPELLHSTSSRPGYAREQFGLDDAALWLEEREAEEVLFRWAFQQAAHRGRREPQRLPRGRGHPHLEHDRALRRPPPDALLAAAGRAPAGQGAPRLRRWTSTGARTARTARRSRPCWRWWTRCARWRSTQLVAAQRDEIETRGGRAADDRQGVPGDAGRARRSGPPKRKRA